MARYIVLMVQLVLILLPTLVASYAFSCTHISPLFNRVTTILHTAKTESATCATQNVVSSTDRYSSGHSLHLISLPPKDDSFSLPAESLVRECWKWKDDVLGDGRDYFVPRPKSLRAFNSLFVGMEICVDVERGEEHEIDGKMAYVLNGVTLKIPSIGCGEGSRFEVELPMEQLSAVKQSKGVEGTPKTYLIEECVALSNCARFEVILALKETTQQQASENYSVPLNAASTVAEYAARLSVAYHLWRQTQNYRSNNASLLRRTGLAYWLDLPDSVETSHASCNYFTENNTRASSLLLEHTQDIKNFSQRLACIGGGLSISRHLSLIASGLAPRTNRPSRDVIFRPYSSRDAHILLQLKRTVEVVSVLGVKSEKNAMDQYHKRKDSGGRGRIKILLDGALNAGKAVRNENVVPEIRQLKEFGSDGTPPIGLANVVAEAAIRLGVNPSIEKCVARLTALEASNQISLLRKRVDDIVFRLAKHGTHSADKSNDKPKNQPEISLELKKMANEVLHAPTIQLREGEISEQEMENLVQCIESQLKEYYSGLTLMKATL